MDIIIKLLHDPIFYVFIFLGLLFLANWRRMSKTQRDDRLEAGKIVADVINECRKPERQRFVTDDTVEFVFLYLGTEELHLIWIRVCISKTSAKATVCQIPGLRQKHSDLAYWLVEEFQKQNGWEVSRETTERQPEKWETGIEENLIGLEDLS